MTTDHHLRTLIPILFLILAGCVTPRPPQIDLTPEIRQMTSRSEFIFVGTVLLINSSTIHVEDVKDLAVVRVDKILNAPPVFQGLRNEQVTLNTKNISKFKEGQRRVFFTNGWQFGESIAVVEVGSTLVTEETPDTERLSKQIDYELQDIKDNELRARLAKATFIVAGKVTSIQKSPDTVPLITEHDPDWWDAVIEVNNVIKGNNPGPSLTVSFANSMDVMWLNAPKLSVGDEGIFIVNEEYPEELEKVRAPYPVLLDSDDIQPIENLSRIEVLSQ